MKNKKFKIAFENIHPNDIEKREMLQNIMNQKKTYSFPFWKLCLIPVLLFTLFLFNGNQESPSLMGVKTVGNDNSNEIIRFEDNCYQKTVNISVEYLGESLTNYLYKNNFNGRSIIRKEKDNYFLYQKIECQTER